MKGRERGLEKRNRRTFLDLGFLHLVVEGLLQVSLVVVGEFVKVDLHLLLIHGRCVWKVEIWLSGL